MITEIPVKLSILSAGYCLHPELLTLRGVPLSPLFSRQAIP